MQGLCYIWRHILWLYKKAPGRRLCTYQAAALVCVKWRHDRHLSIMTSSEIGLRQLMRIYVKKNPAKCHPEPIWNDGALIRLYILKTSPQEEQEEDKMSSDMMWYDITCLIKLLWYASLWDVNYFCVYIGLMSVGALTWLSTSVGCRDWLNVY